MHFLKHVSCEVHPWKMVRMRSKTSRLNYLRCKGEETHIPFRGIRDKKYCEGDIRRLSQHLLIG